MGVLILLPPKLRVTLLIVYYFDLAGLCGRIAIRLLSAYSVTIVGMQHDYGRTVCRQSTYIKEKQITLLRKAVEFRTMFY